MSRSFLKKKFIFVMAVLGLLSVMMTADETLCRQPIEQHTPNDFSKQQHISRQDFRKSAKQLFNPDHSHVYQDMTQPMTNYFIASSHNTYLTAGQLIGPSKIEAYIGALTKGCRCVEVDCWDGDDGVPVIHHGYTLTSKILFRDVIKAIKRYAFTTTPYPLILSLENHCSADHQKLVANYMTEILGSDMLWYPKEEFDHIPSPHDLRMKVIIQIQGNTLPAYVDSDYVSIENGKESKEIDETSEIINHRHKTTGLCPELSHIIGMISFNFRDPKQASTTGDILTIFSLSESHVEKLLKTDANAIVRVTHNKLVRVYPSGILQLLLSTNFNPVPAWNHGCQIVALNYQTGSDAMQLNQGRFMDNGRSGYILKPYFLLSEDMFGIVDGTVKRSNMSKNLQITIISGCQIPRPNSYEKGEIIDPYVEIELHGVKSDNRKQRTKTVNNNGFNPYWNETFSFNVRVPELALLRFVVKDDDWMMDDFLCYYSLPFMSVQQGYRHFPVYDKFGNQFPQTLIFTHIGVFNQSVV